MEGFVRTYDAYGGRWPEADGARGGYAGGVVEPELGWYQLEQRFYIPWLRRFASPDPVSPFDEGGFTRYAYCAGDPVNRIDPRGTAWWDWLGAALGAVAAVAATVATLGAAAPMGALAMAGLVADVVTTGVELAAAIALEAGEETVGGVLGWIALGTGIASTGLAIAASSTVRRSARSVFGGGRTPPGSAGAGGADEVLRRPQKFIGSYKGSTPWVPVGYTRETIRHGVTEVSAYRGVGVADNPTLGRPLYDDPNTKLTQFVPGWLKYRNSAGGTNHVVDTAIYGAQAEQYINANIPNDGRPIVIVSGVHGIHTGQGQWANGVRLYAKPDFYQADLARVDRIAAATGRSPADIQVQPLGGADESHFMTLIQSNAHIVHAYCFSAADPVLTNALHIRYVNTFNT